MPLDQRNLTMATATGFVFSLFDVASAREVPFGIPQYIINRLTCVLPCVPIIFADSKKCWWVAGTRGEQNSGFKNERGKLGQVIGHSDLKPG